MARITLLPAACPVCDRPASRAIHEHHDQVHQVLRCATHGRLSHEGMTVASLHEAWATAA